MKLRIAAACALACLSLAGPALAEIQLTATLAQPTPKRVKLIAAHAVWVCQDATCVATLAPDDGLSLDACRDLAKHVGPLSAFAGPRKSLAAEVLDKCNAAAPAPASAATTTASR